jgi:hypothetical protein
MLLTIVSFRYPGLPGAVHTALQALLLTVALLAAVSLVVAVCMAVAPHLPMLATGTFVTIGYAMLTQPRKAMQACK